MARGLMKYEFGPHTNQTSWQRFRQGAQDALGVTLDPLGATYSLFTKGDSAGGRSLLNILGEHRHELFPESYKDESSVQYRVGTYVGGTLGAAVQLASLGKIALLSVGVNMSENNSRYAIRRRRKPKLVDIPEKVR